MTTRPVAFSILALALSGALSACGGNAGSLPGAGGPVPRLGHRSSTPIQHIVVLIQENRTFNNLFAQFPGTTGSTTGLERVGSKSKQIALKQVPLRDKRDLNHLYRSYLTAYDNGKMDGFNKIAGRHGFEKKLPYQYVKQGDVQPYWDLAAQYGIANAMFSTQGSGSFTAHQDLIRGGTEIGGDVSLIDDPTSNTAWGCDSPKGTKTSLITTSLVVKPAAGPFPCTDSFPYGSYDYTTLRDPLDSAGVSWKYYIPKWKRNTLSARWSAFDVIAPVRNGSEWTDGHISSPETNIYTDLTSGTLPKMAWVVPDGYNSDHPGYSSDTGPSWVSSVVNAIGQSSYWDSTAIVVVWDDWGGFYDPVAPPTQDDQGGPGFRVPMIVISPYVPAGEISQTVYGFGSILKFVEGTFKLKCLGTTDCSSTSIADMFNFNQKPRAFKTIKAKYPDAYFRYHKPSGLPVDDQ
jgi:phospholipase C